ncbi:MAG TPA: hypothetical protein VGO41_12125 [Steroidobacteraceae bacterium]|jgi:hypothetical protein|nr:hypothetical protein [Steroidobacteraceae bacterium]
MFNKVLAAAIALCLVPAMLSAAEPKPRELLQPPTMAIASPITDHFALRGSYYQPSISTDLRYDPSTGGPGTVFSTEDAFGMDDELNKGTMEMMIRMLDRHRLRVDFFKLTRHGDAVLTQGLQFGDDSYLVGDRVVSDLDVRMLGLTYTYSVIRAERFEFGVGLGLHLIQAEGMGSVPLRGLSQEFDAAGPFPTIAVDGTYRVTKRFSINAHAQYFGIGIDEVDGSLGIYHADVQFRAWSNLAFGLGYTKTTVSVDSTDPDFTGRLGLDVSGPEAFVRVSF